MKTRPCSAKLPRPAGSSTAARRSIAQTLLQSFALTVACGALLAPRASAAGDEDFMVNIRTTVDREYTLFSKKPAVVHSKLYALAWIKQARGNSDYDLISPVDENALLGELHDILAARGFHEPEEGKVPDVVLTVLYGRSKLKNPYDDNVIAIAGGGISGGFGGISTGPGNASTDAHSVADGGADQVIGGIDMLISEKTPGANKEKRLLANGEKAFISLTAWEFPGFIPTPKPKMLWRATVNVDDPTLDLNMVGEKMLAVAAPYFDRELKEKEISLSSTLATTASPQKALSDAGPHQATK